jgi:transcriptional regulator with XRE-family HTH domain
MKRFNPVSIKIIRTTKGMTLEQFAESLGEGVSRQIVWQWENAAQVPSVQSLLRIVNAHNVPFEIFFEQDVSYSNHKQEADSNVA